MVISGDDALTLPILALGGSGVISVVGNAFPSEFSKLVNAAMNGEMETARKQHYALASIIENLFVEGNPGGIKEVLKHMGICGNSVRLPLVPVGEKTSQVLYRLVAELDGQLA